MSQLKELVYFNKTLKTRNTQLLSIYEDMETGDMVLVFEGDVPRFETYKSN